MYINFVQGEVNDIFESLISAENANGISREVCEFKYGFLNNCRALGRDP